MRGLYRWSLLIAATTACAGGCAFLPSGSARYLPATPAAALLAAQARQYEKAGRLQKARATYLELTARVPDKPLPYHRLGVLSDRLGRHEDAELYYKKSIALDADNADLLNDMGYSYQLQDRLEEAERTLRLALSLDPGHPRARNNLGFVLGRQGKLKESLDMFRQVLPEAQARDNLALIAPAEQETLPQSQIPHDSRGDGAVVETGSALARLPRGHSPLPAIDTTDLGVAWVEVPWEAPLADEPMPVGIAFVQPNAAAPLMDPFEMAESLEPKWQPVKKRNDRPQEFEDAPEVPAFPLWPRPAVVAAVSP